jgi:hypothetical protein
LLLSLLEQIATTVSDTNEKAPDHQARGSKVCLGNALRACPIESWHGYNFTLRMRPEAFRSVMYRRWDSIQHDCHHALVFKKKQHQLKHYLLRVITMKLVALYLELRYSRFREEHIQVVSVRITQRFAGHEGVRLI